MKKLVIMLICVTMLTSMWLVPVMAKGEFNEFGYNYNARIFNGIGENWYRGKSKPHLGPWEEGQPFYWDETYGLDRLVMKWSKAWDDARFDGGEWTPKAWCTNHWNGHVPGGSGETQHYKIIWVGPDGEDSPYWRDGGYLIWGEFEVIMSHGTVANEHFWEAHANPAGLGDPLGT